MELVGIALAGSALWPAQTPAVPPLVQPNNHISLTYQNFNSTDRLTLTTLDSVSVAPDPGLASNCPALQPALGNLANEWLVLNVSDSTLDDAYFVMMSQCTVPRTPVDMQTLALSVNAPLNTTAVVLLVQGRRYTSWETFWLARSQLDLSEGCTQGVDYDSTVCAQVNCSSPDHVAGQATVTATGSTVYSHPTLPPRQLCPATCSVSCEDYLGALIFVRTDAQRATLPYQLLVADTAAQALGRSGTFSLVSVPVLIPIQLPQSDFVPLQGPLLVFEGVLVRLARTGSCAQRGMVGQVSTGPFASPPLRITGTGDALGSFTLTVAVNQSESDFKEWPLSVDAADDVVVKYALQRPDKQFVLVNRSQYISRYNDPTLGGGRLVLIHFSAPDSLTELVFGPDPALPSRTGVGVGGFPCSASHRLVQNAVQHLSRGADSCLSCDWLLGGLPIYRAHSATTVLYAVARGWRRRASKA